MRMCALTWQGVTARMACHNGRVHTLHKTQAHVPNINARVQCVPNPRHTHVISTRAFNPSQRTFLSPHQRDGLEIFKSLPPLDLRRFRKENPCFSLAPW